MQSSAQNRVEDYMSAADTSFTYLNFTQVQNAGGWNMGESSSSSVPNLINHNDQNGESVWASSRSVASGVHPIFQERHSAPSSVYSSNVVNLNSHHISHGPTFSQNLVPPVIPQNLNNSVGFDEQGVDDCQIVECPPIFKSTLSDNARLLSGDSSSNPIEINVGGHEEGNDRLESRHFSRKRKAVEGNIGQSSANGSSNYFERTESAAWHVLNPQQNVGNSLNISSTPGNVIGSSQMDHLNPRFQLGVEGVVSESPPTLSAIGVSESSRNLRLRFTSSHQPDSPPNYMFTIGNATGPSNHLSAHLPPTIAPLSSPLGMLSSGSTNSGVPHSHVSPAMLRNLQSSRRNRTSSSRTNSSSSSAIPVGNRDFVSFDESRSRSIQRNVSEHPMFIPTTGMRNSARSQTNRGNNISRNVSSSGPTSGAHPSSAHNVVHNGNSVQYSQYSQRLLELVRRSLLSSSVPEITNPPASAQGMAVSSRNQGDHLSRARAATLLDRHLDGSLGVPHSLGTLAVGAEGRRRFLSEIRNVLDQMRRGEGLRFEDVMMLDQSGFFGTIGGVHDRHRDMRMDVDNMSYEELLALEDRIGYVNTGLSEETILKCVKKRKYTVVETDQKELEPCCICQEEYIVGDNLGELDCGHDFHTQCIKEWLTHKNTCPICKKATVDDTKEKS